MMDSKRTLTAQECADELDLSVELVRDYAMRGCPHDKGGRGKPNRFDADEVTAWMRENGYTGKPGRPAEESPDIEKARLREINLRCRKHELDVAEREGSLLDANDVDRGRVSRIHIVKAKLMGLGAALAPSLYGRDAAEIQTIIEKATTDICEEFARPSK